MLLSQKTFSQVATRLPKCEISKAATSQVCPSACPPPLRPAALQIASHNLWEFAPWDVAQLGSCHLESAFGKVPYTMW